MLADIHVEMPLVPPCPKTYETTDPMQLHQSSDPKHSELRKQNLNKSTQIGWRDTVWNLHPDSVAAHTSIIRRFYPLNVFVLETNL